MTGIELKAKRDELGLTQEALARELNITLSSVARWEQLKDKEIQSPLLPLALEAVENRMKKSA